MKKLISLFFVFYSSILASSQTIFYYDNFKGGTTADGYAPDYDGFGSANLQVSIAPGSTIRKAYLLASRLGLASNLTVQLAGNNLNFDLTNEVSGGFNSIYGSPSGVHAIDVTALINPAINSYLISVPIQPGPNDRYQGFYLYIAYENTALDTVYSAIVLNTLDMGSNSYTYNITFPSIINNVNDVGVSLFCGYICFNDASDWTEVTVNGTNIGSLGGPDPNSGVCGGPVGSYFYQNQLLAGLNADNANSVVFGDDALFNAQSYFPLPTNTINLGFTNNSSNHIYALVFNWITTPCSNFNVNLGANQSICSGDSVILTATGGGSYLWQDNSTDSFLVAYTPGTYWVQVNNGSGCTAIDSIQISTGINPVINLGADTSICIGTSIIFNAGAGFNSYLWNTTETTSTITASNIGSYNVTVSNTAGCLGSDTVKIISYLTLPSPNLGNDTSFCDGNSISITPGNSFESYSWNDASTNSNLIIQNTGLYWVEVTNINGCKNTDSIEVQIDPLPTFSLGADVEICAGTPYIIEPSNVPINSTYIWSDTSNLPTLTVLNEGNYFLTITNELNCSYIDSIDIFNNCDYSIYVPNTFTPNFDENNPLFKAYGTQITNFKMVIFNRWGQLIYTINNIQDGWNGNYNQQPVMQGVYAYRILYSTTNKVDIELMGLVNLIR